MRPQHQAYWSLRGYPVIRIGELSEIKTRSVFSALSCHVSFNIPINHEYLLSVFPCLLDSVLHTCWLKMWRINRSPNSTVRFAVDGAPLHVQKRNISNSNQHQTLQQCLWQDSRWIIHCIKLYHETMRFWYWFCMLLICCSLDFVWLLQEFLVIGGDFWTSLIFSIVEIDIHLIKLYKASTKNSLSIFSEKITVALAGVDILDGNHELAKAAGSGKFAPSFWTLRVTTIPRIYWSRAGAKHGGDEGGKLV